MPFIRSSASKRCTLFTTFISFNRKIISPYTYYIKKGLVYIIIISLSSRQPSSYLKYTKANTRSSYNVCLVPFNKYRFLYYARRYTYYNL